MKFFTKNLLLPLVTLALGSCLLYSALETIATVSKTSFYFELFFSLLLFCFAIWLFKLSYHLYKGKDATYYRTFSFLLCLAIYFFPVILFSEDLQKIDQFNTTIASIFIIVLVIVHHLLGKPLTGQFFLPQKRTLGFFCFLIWLLLSDFILGDLSVSESTTGPYIIIFSMIGIPLCCYCLYLFLIFLFYRPIGKTDK